MRFIFLFYFVFSNVNNSRKIWITKKNFIFLFLLILLKEQRVMHSLIQLETFINLCILILFVQFFITILK